MADDSPVTNTVSAKIIQQAADAQVARATQQQTSGATNTTTVGDSGLSPTVQQVGAVTYYNPNDAIKALHDDAVARGVPNVPAYYLDTKSYTDAASAQKAIDSYYARIPSTYNVNDTLQKIHDDAVAKGITGVPDVPKYNSLFTDQNIAQRAINNYANSIPPTYDVNSAITSAYNDAVSKGITNVPKPVTDSKVYTDKTQADAAVKAYTDTIPPTYDVNSAMQSAYDAAVKAAGDKNSSIIPKPSADSKVYTDKTQADAAVKAYTDKLPTIYDVNSSKQAAYDAAVKAVGSANASLIPKPSTDDKVYTDKTTADAAVKAYTDKLPTIYDVNSSKQAAYDAAVKAVGSANASLIPKPPTDSKVYTDKTTADAAVKAYTDKLPSVYNVNDVMKSAYDAAVKAVGSANASLIPKPPTSNTVYTDQTKANAAVKAYTDKLPSVYNVNDAMKSAYDAAVKTVGSANASLIPKPTTDSGVYTDQTKANAAVKAYTDKLPKVYDISSSLQSAYNTAVSTVGTTKASTVPKPPATNLVFIDQTKAQSALDSYVKTLNTQITALNGKITSTSVQPKAAQSNVVQYDLNTSLGQVQKDLLVQTGNYLNKPVDITDTIQKIQNAGEALGIKIAPPTMLKYANVSDGTMAITNYLNLFRVQISNGQMNPYQFVRNFIGNTNYTAQVNKILQEQGKTNIDPSKTTGYNFVYEMNDNEVDNFHTWQQENYGANAGKTEYDFRVAKGISIIAMPSSGQNYTQPQIVGNRAREDGKYEGSTSQGQVPTYVATASDFSKLNNAQQDAYLKQVSGGTVISASTFGSLNTTQQNAYLKSVAPKVTAVSVVNTTPAESVKINVNAISHAGQTQVGDGIWKDVAGATVSHIGQVQLKDGTWLDQDVKEGASSDGYHPNEILTVNTATPTQVKNAESNIDKVFTLNPDGTATIKAGAKPTDADMVALDNAQYQLKTKGSSSSPTTVKFGSTTVTGSWNPSTGTTDPVARQQVIDAQIQATANAKVYAEQVKAAQIIGKDGQIIDAAQKVGAGDSYNADEKIISPVFASQTDKNKFLADSKAAYDTFVSTGAASLSDLVKSTSKSGFASPTLNRLQNAENAVAGDLAKASFLVQSSRDIEAVAEARSDTANLQKIAVTSNMTDAQKSQVQTYNASIDQARADEVAHASPTEKSALDAKYSKIDTPKGSIVASASAASLVGTASASPEAKKDEKKKTEDAYVTDKSSDLDKVLSYLIPQGAIKDIDAALGYAGSKLNEADKYASGVLNLPSYESLKPSLDAAEMYNPITGGIMLGEKVAGIGYDAFANTGLGKTILGTKVAGNTSIGDIVTTVSNVNSGVSKGVENFIKDQYTELKEKPVTFIGENAALALVGGAAGKAIGVVGAEAGSVAADVVTKLGFEVGTEASPIAKIIGKGADLGFSGAAIAQGLSAAKVGYDKGGIAGGVEAALDFTKNATLTTAGFKAGAGATGSPFILNTNTGLKAQTPGKDLFSQVGGAAVNVASNVIVKGVDDAIDVGVGGYNLVSTGIRDIEAGYNAFEQSGIGKMVTPYINSGMAGALGLGEQAASAAGNAIYQGGKAIVDSNVYVANKAIDAGGITGKFLADNYAKDSPLGELGQGMVNFSKGDRLANAIGIGSQIIGDVEAGFNIADKYVAPLTDWLPSSQQISNNFLVKNVTGFAGDVASKIASKNATNAAVVGFGSGVASGATDLIGGTYDFTREHPVTAGAELGAMYLGGEVLGAGFEGAQILGRGALEGGAELLESSVGRSLEKGLLGKVVDVAGKNTETNIMGLTGMGTSTLKLGAKAVDPIADVYFKGQIIKGAVDSSNEGKSSTESGQNVGKYIVHTAGGLLGFGAGQKKASEFFETGKLSTLIGVGPHSAGDKSVLSVLMPKLGTEDIVHSTGSVVDGKYTLDPKGTIEGTSENKVKVNGIDSELKFGDAVGKTETIKFDGKQIEVPTQREVTINNGAKQIVDVDVKIVDGKLTEVARIPDATRYKPPTKLDTIISDTKQKVNAITETGKVVAENILPKGGNEAIEATASTTKSTIKDVTPENVKATVKAGATMISEGKLEVPTLADFGVKPKSIVDSKQVVYKSGNIVTAIGKAAEKGKNDWRITTPLKQTAEKLNLLTGNIRGQAIGTDPSLDHDQVTYLNKKLILQKILNGEDLNLSRGQGGGTGVGDKLSVFGDAYGRSKILDSSGKVISDPWAKGYDATYHDNLLAEMEHGNPNGLQVDTEKDPTFKNDPTQRVPGTYFSMASASEPGAPAPYSEIFVANSRNTNKNPMGILGRTIQKGLTKVAKTGDETGIIDNLIARKELGKSDILTGISRGRTELAKPETSVWLNGKKVLIDTEGLNKADIIRTENVDGQNVIVRKAKVGGTEIKEKKGNKTISKIVGGTEVEVKTRSKIIGNNRVEITTIDGASRPRSPATNLMGTLVSSAADVATFVGDVHNTGTSYKGGEVFVLKDVSSLRGLDPTVKATADAELENTGKFTPDTRDKLVQHAMQLARETGKPVAGIPPKMAAGWTQPENEVFLYMPDGSANMIDASLYKGTDLAKSGKDFKTITSMKSMGKTKSGARVKEITLGDMSTDRAPKSKTATFLENIAAKHLPLKTRVENIKWNTDLGRDIFGIYNKSVQGYYERNIIQPKVRQEILKSEKPQLGAADSESHGPKHLGDVARNIKTDYAKLKETNPNVRLSPFKEISDDKYADLLGQFHDAAKVGAKEIPGIDHGVAAARAIVAKRTGDSFVDSQMTDAQRLQLAKDLAYHDTQQPWSSGDLPAAVKTTLGRTSTAAKLLSNADREDLTRFGIKPNKFKMFNVGYWDTTKQDISGVPRTVLDTTKTVVSGTSKGIANMMANTSASASFGGLGTSSNKSGSSTRANSNGNAAPKSSSVDVNNIVSKGTEMKSTNASLLSDITSRVDSQSSLDGLLTNTSGLTPTDKNALNVLQNVTDANRNARTFVTVKTPDGRAIKTNDVDQASQLVSRSGGKVVGIDSIDTRAQDIQTTINKLTSNFNSEASNMTVAQKKAAKAELDATISKLKQDAKIINTENKNNVSGDSLVGKGKAVSNKQEVKQPINSYADKQSLIEEMAGSKKLPTNETSGKIPTKEDDQETLYNALTGEKNKPEYPSSYESTKPENGYEYLVKKNNKDYDYKPQAKKEYGYLPQSKKDYGYLPQAKTEYKEPYAKTEYKEPYAKTEYKEPYQKADYKEPYKTDYKEPYPRTEYRDPYDYVQSKYPTGKYPAGNYPSGKYPTGSYPAGKYPSGSYPTGKYQAGVYPAGNYPGDSYPGGNYPSDKKIASLYPVGGKHIDDKPREEKKRKIEEVHRFPRRDLEADADKLVVRTKVQTFREAMSGKSITTPTLDTSDDLLTGESRVPPTTKSKITTGSNVGTFRDMVNGNVKSGMPKQPARTTPKQPPKQPPKQATNQISKIDMNKLSTGVQNKIKAIQKEHKTQGKPKIGTNEKPVKVTESNMALGKFMGFTPTTKQTKTKKDGKNSGMLNGLL